MDEKTAKPTGKKNHKPLIIIGVIIVLIGLGYLFLRFKGADLRYRKYVKSYIASINSYDSDAYMMGVSGFYESTLGQYPYTKLSSSSGGAKHAIASLKDSVTYGKGVKKIGKLNKVRDYTNEPAYAELKDFYSRIGADVKVTGIATVNVELTDDSVVTLTMFNFDGYYWKVYDMTISSYICKYEG